MGEWISVKDRLPVEKENRLTHDFAEVICAVDFGGLAGRDVRVYKFGRGHFWHGPQIMDGIITDWMYLPEPPLPIAHGDCGAASAEGALKKLGIWSPLPEAPKEV